MQINEEKYILVSFLPLTVENCARIIPDFLKGRDIIDLSKGITGDSRLLYRLTDTNEYDFSPVSPRKVIPKPIYIGELESGSVSGEEINNLRKRSKRMRAYQSQSNLFHLGGKVLRFIPIIGSWNYKEDEYYLGDIIVKTNQSRYTLPNEILEVFNKMNNIREQEKKSILKNTNETKVRVDDYSVNIVGGMRPHQLVFEFRPVLYRDYLIVRNTMEQMITEEDTVRSKYFNHKQSLISKQLSNICGVGIFIITSDNKILFSQASKNVVVNPDKYIYTASGTMDWNNEYTNPFNDILRETKEEIGYLPNIENTVLYSFGIDYDTGYYQFSFYEKSNYTAEEILENVYMARDFYIEIQNITPVDFNYADVIEFIDKNNWDETAKANLLTLLVKFNGKSTIEAFMNPKKEKKDYRRNVSKEWERRAEREGRFAVLSNRYPSSDINIISEEYCEHVIGFIDENLSETEVLEIGGGIGLFTEIFAKKAKYITCIDVSEGMIKRNKKNLGKLADKVKFVNCFFQDYEENAFFDIVICSLVLIHNAPELQDIANNMKKYSDVIYLFEHVEDGAQVSMYTEPKTEEEYINLFPEYYVEKKDYHLLATDKIAFLKLVRKLRRK